MTQLEPKSLSNPQDSTFQGNAVVVDLTWEASSDLDLAALCVRDDSNEGTLVYYGMRGNRCAMPFVHLGIDHDGGGRRKNRREHLVMSDVSAHDAIYLFAWDHDAMEDESLKARREGTRKWRVSLLDRFNQRRIVEGAFSETVNLHLVGVLRKQQFQRLCQEAFAASRGELLSTIRSLVDLPLEIAA